MTDEFPEISRRPILTDPSDLTQGPTRSTFSVVGAVRGVAPWTTVNCTVSFEFFGSLRRLRSFQLSLSLSLSLSLYLSLSVLTAIFQVNLGQQVPIEAKDDGGGGHNWTTGTISRAKLQPNHHHQQTNIQFLQAGRPSCRPTNSVKALKGKHHIPWTCLPQAHLGSSTLSLTTNSS